MFVCLSVHNTIVNPTQMACEVGPWGANPASAVCRPAYMLVHFKHKILGIDSIFIFHSKQMK